MIFCLNNSVTAKIKDDVIECVVGRSTKTIVFTRKKERMSLLSCCVIRGSGNNI